MRIVFNVYKAFASKMNQEEFRLYAFKILLPLYKVYGGFRGKIIADELKQLAEEVRDSIRDKTLGNQMFVEVYSEIRKSLRTKRDKRKQEEKLMAVVNPERNAKRKLSSPFSQYVVEVNSDGDVLIFPEIIRYRRAYHENLLWKRFEEIAREFQSRRLVNPKLLDVKKHFQPHVSPPLDNSLSPLPASSVNQRVSVKENEKGSDDDTIKVSQSLEDRLPDIPFYESAAETNVRLSSKYIFDAMEDVCEENAVSKSTNDLNALFDFVASSLEVHSSLPDFVSSMLLK